jgi:hypothetical protein
MKRVLTGLALAVAGLLAIAPGALATGTLDQQQTNASLTTLTWSIPPVAGSRMDLRQSFVAGKTGTLDTVSVDGNDFGASVALDVYDSSGGLDHQTINLTGSGWTQVALATPPAVTSGEQLYLILTPSNEINWYGTCDDLYASGQAFVYDPNARTVETIPQYGISTGNSIGYCTLDFAFQTYVTVPPVATPTPKPTPVPTPVPTKPPAAAPTVAPTVVPAVSAGPTAGASTDASPASSGMPGDVALASPASSVLDLAAGPSDSPPPASSLGSPAGDSGGSGPPIVPILIVLVLLALGGGASYLWWRRRQA